MSTICHYAFTSGQWNNGLTNQLMQIVAAIITALRKQCKILVLFGYSVEVTPSRPRCNLNEVLNIDAINQYVRAKYNLLISDQITMSFHVLHEDSSHVRFLLDGYEFVDTKPFVNPKEREITQSDYDEWWWYGYQPPDLFYDIFYNLQFQRKYYDYVKTFLDGILQPSPTKQEFNAIHLRFEQDMIDYLTRTHECSDELVRQELTTAYVALVEKHFDPKVPVLVLTSKTDNDVCAYFTSNKYSWYVLPKTNCGFYIDAVYDFMFGLQCTNVFIGCFNRATDRGSAFSLALEMCLHAKVQVHQICLDQCAIQAKKARVKG